MSEEDINPEKLLLEHIREDVAAHNKMEGAFDEMIGRLDRLEKKVDENASKAIAINDQLKAGKLAAKLLVWIAGAASVFIGLWLALKSLLPPPGA